MISLLTGSIRHLTTEKVVIEVGGVGYSLSITARTSNQLVLGAITTLHTTLVVREDSMTLFGFLDARDRDLYETVQTVSGIGPKVALAITGAMTPNEIATAIAQEDVGAIEKIPGIGKKGAQRLILELKGKLIGEISTTSSAPVHLAVRDQLLSALIGLGFSARESDSAINSTLAHLAEESIDPSTLEVAELLRMTLQSGKR
jgi:holliday junction DNA helicase RuvA